MGAAAVPLIMAGVSAGANYYNTQQTTKRQDNELARQIMAQGQRQQAADKLVNDQVLRQSQSNPAEAQRKSLDEYLTQLQRTQGNATSGLRQAGAVSDRFGEDASAAGGDIAASGQQTAGILSRIDAPKMQRQEEGIQFGRLASDLDRVRAQSASDAYLGDLRLKSIRRNPWLDALATGASAFASGYSGGSGLTGGASAGGTTQWGAFGPGAAGWKGL